MNPAALFSSKFKREPVMRTAIFAFVSGVALLFSAGAFADQTQPAQVQTASATSDTMICHRIYHEGTLVSGMQCHTKHWWDLNRFRQQQALSDLQLRGSMKNPY